MATIKHIASKSSNYGTAEEYLRFEHDELTGKPVLSEDGFPVLRKDALIETVGCAGEDFAISCMKTNLHYQKNLARDEIKSHHYIISFDPRDKTEKGLTPERAMELGKEFCRKNFEGHQAILGVHPDGHNGTGNIHIHIIINSLRAGPAEQRDYMDRRSDTLPGCKHRCTASAFRYLRKEVMDMCEREDLYQVDLLSGRKQNIRDREYQAIRSGKRKQEERDRIREMVGCPVSKLPFETSLETLRKIISAARDNSVSLEDFRQNLSMEGIELRESRGRFSYLPKGRSKPISSRRLGTDYSKEYVLSCLEQSSPSKKSTVDSKTPEASVSSFQKRLAFAKKASENHNLGRIIDPEKAKGKGKGYENWVKLHNLKVLAEALYRYDRMGYGSIRELEGALEASIRGDPATYRELKQIRAILEKSGIRIRENIKERKENIEPDAERTR